MTIKKTIAAGLTGLSLIAVPALALANNDSSRNAFNPRSVGSTLEVIISDSGNVLVRGAQVTDVSGSTISARTEWGNSTINWSVKTNNDTNFTGKLGGSEAFADIDDGDYVSFTGPISTGAGAFTVNATVVRDWSKDMTVASVFSGTVSNVNNDNNTLTLTGTKDGTITVKTNGDTDYVKTGDDVNFSDIDNGDTVSASGSYNSDTKVLTASKIMLGVHISFPWYHIDFKNMFPHLGGFFHFGGK